MELKSRKSLRLKEYDYSSVGIYFITVCTKDKKPILGNLIKDTTSTELSAIGHIAEKHIRRIRGISKYVIMPDHIHLLINITAPVRPAIATDLQPLLNHCFCPTEVNIPQEIRAFKLLCTKEVGEPLWQRSYYDRIIRDNAELNRIWYYIEQNPKKL